MAACTIAGAVRAEQHSAVPTVQSSPLYTPTGHAPRSRCWPPAALRTNGTNWTAVPRRHPGQPKHSARQPQSGEAALYRREQGCGIGREQTSPPASAVQCSDARCQDAGKVASAVPSTRTSCPAVPRRSCVLIPPKQGMLGEQPDTPRQTAYYPDCNGRGPTGAQQRGSSCT